MSCLKIKIASLMLLGLCSAAGNADTTRVVHADISRVIGPHTKAPLECVGAGRANEGLRADFQEQLATVQKEIGFKYLRMHGIFHDDMGVYKEDKQGNPEFNFQYIDTLYDALLKLKIKPFVELSFMPSALASGTKTIFWWKGNVTPPRDMTKWNALNRAFVKHLLERYGADEVHSWYFEVWNEPDLKDGFFTGTLEDYLELYKNTAEAIKVECPECKVGGPASASGYDFEKAFEKYVVDQNVPAEFVATHVYGVKKGFLDADNTAGTVLDPDPDSVSGRMRRSRELIQQSGRPNMELHFTEWSSAYTPSDYMHDQYHQASFILDKVKRGSPFVDSMSYWTFTDIFEENGPRFTPFHGGFGLLNLQGIKKPAYFAYRYLAQLGNQDVTSNDAQSWVTKSNDGSVQALVWDYTPIVAPKGQINQIFYKQELPAKSKGKLTLELNHVPNGKYRVSVYATGYNHNDVFTAYARMGMPSQITRAQVDTLNKLASGKPEFITEVTITDGKYRFESTLLENDVKFVVLSPAAKE